MQLLSLLVSLSLAVLIKARLPVTDEQVYMHIESNSELNEFHTMDDALLAQWMDMDVVEVMKLVGMGDGLEERRLVQFFDDEFGLTIVTEGEKLRLKKAGVHFMDVTDHLDLGKVNALKHAEMSTFAYVPRESSNAATIRILGDLDEAIPNLQADIAKLSSFWTRNSRSQWGLSSSNWVHDHVSGILKNASVDVVTSVRKFSHEWPQNSIIARIESEPARADKPLIIIGAHQDSLNYALPFYRAPGSDDDGSGTVTIMQVLRSLVQHNFMPPKELAIEFHWYAAEELGLLGSQDVAAAYEKAGAKVKSMMQVDMTAYVKPKTTPIVGLFDTNVNMNFTNYIGNLVNKYSLIGWNYTHCGTGCGSDHMSWSKAGYPSAFLIESLFEDSSPHVHTSDDYWEDENYSFEHMLEFVKVGIAYITEIAVAESHF